MASELLRAEEETAAFLFANVVGRGEYGERLLVREVQTGTL